MQKFMLTLLMTAAITGCSILGPYKIDIPQGTPLTKAQVEQVKVGMSYQQVRFLLGSPTVIDPLNPLRWDYIYHFIPGTYAKKEKIPAARDQHLKIYFDREGTVVKIEGADTIPDSQPGLPQSKEAILTAPSL